MGPTTDEAALVERLRRGDPAAFREVVAAHQAGMVRFAETFVPSRAIAEEVVQDSWLAAVRGLGGFEGRSTFKTWIYRILANQARSRGARERRTLPFSALGDEQTGDSPSVAADRFAGPPGRGMWATPPRHWSGDPEAQVLAGATFSTVAETVQQLPEQQRRVLVLRDVEGWTSGEVCELLGLTEVNQRVLLHRARSRVRAALERELEEDA